MARNRDPFGDALLKLRDALRDGVIAPGQPLLAAELAVDLKISATPVREALSRLAGEGLVEDRRWRGYYARNPTLQEIEELYALHHAVVDLAVQGRSPLSYNEFGPAPDAMTEPKIFRDRTEHVFATIVQRTEGGAVLRVHQRLSNQLALLRLVEPSALQGVEAELEALVTAATRSSSDLSQILESYYRRRCASRREIAGWLVETFPTARI